MLRELSVCCWWVLAGAVTCTLWCTQEGLGQVYNKTCQGVHGGGSTGMGLIQPILQLNTCLLCCAKLLAKMMFIALLVHQFIYLKYIRLVCSLFAGSFAWGETPTASIS
jgi:hypothetical protein